MRAITAPLLTGRLRNTYAAVLHRITAAPGPHTGATSSAAGHTLRRHQIPADGCGIDQARVALLTNFVAPYRVSLLEALAARVGHLRVFVSTRMEPDRAWQPEQGSLDLVVQRTLTVRSRHRRPGGISQSLFIHVPWDTLAVLLRYRPRLVITGEMGMRSLLAAVYRRMRPNSRLILWATLSEHTEKDWGWIRGALRRAILTSVDAVLVNGPSGRRYIGSLSPGLPTHVVHQPVPAEPFAAVPLYRRPEDQRRLIYSGRLIAQKGVFKLQQGLAARAAAYPGERIDITWAGDGDARGALQDTCLPANLHQCFTGHLDYPRLAGCYASSGALVLPTLFDEWGLVVNEALASGLPVLGSIFSQAAEVMIEDGVTGWLFDPTRPDSVQTGLDRFLTTGEGPLAAMRAAARRRALQVTVAGAVDRILAAACEVLSDGAKQ